ncbi:MAG: amidohydrolase [Acidobacteria bacterium]|nr:amidohydrolase [Acidobacteriota bacterium]
MWLWPVHFMRLISFFLVVLFIGTQTLLGTEKPADTVFLNGNVYTVSDAHPRAEAMAIRNGKLMFVGSTKEARRHIGKATKVVDLQGKTVVPGFTDAHCHLAGIGQRELQLNLEGTTSLDDLLTKIKQRVDQAKPGEWIIGRGWIETFWTPPVFPTCLDLDRVSPKNPVFLQRADGHGAVVNSLVLKMAGISKETPNPAGGEIMRDPKTGEANGMLLDKANFLVVPYLPHPTAEDSTKALLLGIERSLSLGWCQIQIAGNSRAEIDLLNRLYQDGKVKLRIYNAIAGPGPEAEELIKAGPKIGEYGNRFTLRGIKLVLDGALGSKGAALLEPYADYNTTGLLILEEKDVMPLLKEALRQGIQIETHAIGDRANRTILDWYEKAFQAVPPKERKIRDPRWRVEHAQILNLADLPRFQKLGVIPSMQPSHAIGDLHFAPSRIGIKRLAGAYAWKSLLKTGVVIAGGSDAPVERGEPMIEFYAAVARKDQKGFSGEGWHPEEAVTREEALKMLTLWPAYAAFEEKLKGSLEPGKLADFVVLSADIMKIPDPEILKTQCLMTVVGGEVVFENKAK